LTVAPPLTEGTILKSLTNAHAAIKIAALGTSLALASVANIVSAGQFGVRVVDPQGMPVSGASVCFGLPGNYRQFGAVFTDADGQAMTEVPNIPFVVTVSKTRFTGMRINEPARGFNLVKEVTLADGIPGPRCKAGSTLADASEGTIYITNVRVSSDSRATKLVPETSGEPTEYRLSKTPDIAQASWKSFDESIPLTGSQARGEKIFLQLRRFSGTNKAWVEARSRTTTVFLSAPTSSM